MPDREQHESARRDIGKRVPETSNRPEDSAIDVKELFAGRTEIRLLHGGEEYRLRITKQKKLILTK